MSLISGHWKDSISSSSPLFFHGNVGRYLHHPSGGSSDYFHEFHVVFFPDLTSFSDPNHPYTLSLATKEIMGHILVQSTDMVNS